MIRRILPSGRTACDCLHLPARGSEVQFLKMRESFKQEALSSWADYQETGRHLTGQEVRAWLKSWGTEEDGVAPECHSHSSD